MPVYRDAFEMLQGVIDDLKGDEKVLSLDDPPRRLIGFKADRDGAEVHQLGLMALKMRKGVNEDFEDLIMSRRGRERMALAMSHRHQFRGHKCGECSVLEVMED